ENVALILLADRTTESGGVDLETFSGGLFSRTLIIDAGMRPDVRTELERRALQIVDASGKDELALVVELGGSLGFDAAVMFPLNGQWNPKDIPRLVIGLNRGYDLVIASRFIMGRARRRRHRPVRSPG